MYVHDDGIEGAFWKVWTCSVYTDVSYNGRNKHVGKDELQYVSVHGCSSFKAAPASRPASSVMADVFVFRVSQPQRVGTQVLDQNLDHAITLRDPRSCHTYHTP